MAHLSLQSLWGETGKDGFFAKDRAMSVSTPAPNAAVLARRDEIMRALRRIVRAKAPSPISTRCAPMNRMGSPLKHGPEKLADFSDKIMRQDKDKQIPKNWQTFCDKGMRPNKGKESAIDSRRSNRASQA